MYGSGRRHTIACGGGTTCIGMHLHWHDTMVHDAVCSCGTPQPGSDIRLCGAGCAVQGGVGEASPSLSTSVVPSDAPGQRFGPGAATLLLSLRWMPPRSPRSYLGEVDLIHIEGNICICIRKILTSVRV